VLVVLESKERGTLQPFRGKEKRHRRNSVPTNPRTAAESATAQKRRWQRSAPGRPPVLAGKISAAAIQKVSAVLFIAMAPLSGAMGH